jgi:hypothetical protein
MRTIRIPEPVKLHAILKEGKPLEYNFQSFLEEWVWTSPAWKQSSDYLKAAIAVRKQFEPTETAIPAGCEVTLADDDHAKLSEVASKTNLPPTVAGPTLPYVLAIVDAARG